MWRGRLLMSTSAAKGPQVLCRRTAGCASRCPGADGCSAEPWCAHLLYTAAIEQLRVEILQGATPNSCILLLGCSMLTRSRPRPTRCTPM
jgi:hypothetical protein